MQPEPCEFIFMVRVFGVVVRLSDIRDGATCVPYRPAGIIKGRRGSRGIRRDPHPPAPIQDQGEPRLVASTIAGSWVPWGGGSALGVSEAGKRGVGVCLQSKALHRSQNEQGNGPPKLSPTHDSS